MVPQSSDFSMMPCSLYALSGAQSKFGAEVLSTKLWTSWSAGRDTPRGSAYYVGLRGGWALPLETALQVDLAPSRLELFHRQCLEAVVVGELEAACPLERRKVGADESLVVLQKDAAGPGGVGDALELGQGEGSHHAALQQELVRVSQSRERDGR